MDKNARFVAFTSGCGGIGTTSAALVLGRSLSRLCEKKVLFVSFDLISSKAGSFGMETAALYDLYSKPDGNFEELLKSDEYEMCFLSCNSYINPFCVGLKAAESFVLDASHNYDYVIIDVPCNSKEGLLFLSCCEDVIVNFGNGDSYVGRICGAFADFLKILCPESRISHLEYGYDEASFEDGRVDIHGEFGSEVRAFAEKLGIWPEAD